MESNATLGSQTPEELQERQAALDRGEPFLLFRDGDGRQRIVSLGEAGESVTIGRRYEADISLPWDPEASRLHAELSLRAGEWTIVDDGWSQNGTWVNGLRLAGRRRLADGDLVKIGRTILGFHAPSATGPGPPTVTASTRRATSRSPTRRGSPSTSSRRSSTSSPACSGWRTCRAPSSAPRSRCSPSAPGWSARTRADSAGNVPA